MRERISAISMARGLGIGLLALVVTPSHSSVFAQSADLVLCDRIAADPADPDKPTDVKGTPTIAPSDIFVLDSLGEGDQLATWQGGGSLTIVNDAGHLICPAATPARSSTWGAVKTLYR